MSPSIACGLSPFVVAVFDSNPLLLKASSECQREAWRGASYPHRDYCKFLRLFNDVRIVISQNSGYTVDDVLEEMITRESELFKKHEALTSDFLPLERHDTIRALAMCS